MKLAPYPIYQSSGVAWVGEIPSSWEMWKLNHAYSYIGSGTTPESSNEDLYGGDIPWVTTGELRENLICETTKTVSIDTVKKIPSLKIHPEGSIVLAMYGATIGRLGILGVAATTNQACCVLPTSKHLINRYVFYWLQAFRKDIINLSSGGGQPNINQEKVASLRVSAPIIKAQQTIATFLDHETARIDSLIEKQQKLIALLKEKRQAVISHAVTKGLDPTAPMKESGVEWLGEVPTNWNVVKFSHVAIVVRGGSPRPAGDSRFFNGNFIPWVTVAEVTKDEEIYLIQTATFLTKEGGLRSRLFKKGTLVLTNSGATLGVPKIMAMDGCGNDGIVGFETLSDRINIKFAYYFLTSLTHILREEVKQGAGQPNLNTDIVKAISLPLPPLHEQLAIINYIEDVLEKLSRLRNKANDAVTLLYERRTALISAAVTGKIDVRNHPSSQKAA